MHRTAGLEKWSDKEKSSRKPKSVKDYNQIVMEDDLLLGCEGEENDLLTAEWKSKTYTKARKRCRLLDFLVKIDKSVTQTVADKEDVQYLP